MTVSKTKKTTARFFRRVKRRKSSLQQKCCLESRSITDTPRSSNEGMDTHHRWHIISEYGKVLEACSSSVEQESRLPFSKNVIREAIRTELVVNPNCEFRDHLEIAYAQLESFLPQKEFEIIIQFKEASSIARRIYRTGNPGDVVASARILKFAQGDRAVRIQEKISERMRRRLSQIRAVGTSFLHFGQCACCSEM